MKILNIKSILALTFCILLSNTMFAQVKPSAAVKAWDNMTAMVVETAQAMPEKNYAFKPTEGLRDFAEQIGHTTGANYLFASVVKLSRPEPSPTTSTKVKAKVVKELKDSFAFIKGGMTKLTQADLNEEIEFFGSKMSRLQAILIMTSHLQREQGKTTIYTRLKGVAPGQSGGW